MAAGAVRLGARVRRAGAGRPVLLVHGLSSNARLWDEVGTALAAAGHPVVAVDLRGHGTSAAVPDPEDGAGATRTAAADLAAVCAGLGWVEVAGGIVVAGQSWGGNVALQLAVDRPALVHGLALVDGGWLHLGERFADLDAAWAVLAPPRFDGVTARRLRDRLRATHPDWSDTAVAATQANLRELADGTVRPWLERDRHRRIVASMMAHRPRELYHAVRGPCLLLAATGEADPMGSAPLLAEALDLLPQGELAEFPGADHDLHAQHPGRVADLIGKLA